MSRVSGCCSGTRSCAWHCATSQTRCKWQSTTPPTHQCPPQHVRTLAVPASYVQWVPGCRTAAVVQQGKALLLWYTVVADDAAVVEVNSNGNVVGVVRDEVRTYVCGYVSCQAEHAARVARVVG